MALVDDGDAGARERREMRFTLRRTVELELDPVPGDFDAAHLREVNRRLFQDFPGAGFIDVVPGQYRPPVPEGKDWVKARGLETVEGPFYVAYSRMDKSAVARLNEALMGASPDNFRGLKTDEFAKRLGKLYVELDYIHPFSDGNSRTLRVFTKQLAKGAGYDLDWERYNQSAAGRDRLYIARDLSVNRLAMPLVQHDNTMRQIVYATDRLAGNKDLPALLRDAVRPSRAVAFERRSEEEAVKAFPELREAYKTLNAAAAYFTSKMPGQLDAQDRALRAVENHIQERLDKGDVKGFSLESRPAAERNQAER